LEVHVEEDQMRTFAIQGELNNGKVLVVPEVSVSVKRNHVLRINLEKEVVHLETEEIEIETEIENGKDVVIAIVIVTDVQIVLIVETVKIALNVLIVMIVPRKENVTIALSAERLKKVSTLPNELNAKNVECVLNVNVKNVLMMKGRTVIEENVVVVIVSAGIEIGIEIEIVTVVDVTVIAVIRSVNLENETVSAVNVVIRSAMAMNVIVMFQKGGSVIVTGIVRENEKGKERGKGKGIVNHAMKVNYPRMMNPLNLKVEVMTYK